jgi:hypothetical protein
VEEQELETEQALERAAQAALAKLLEKQRKQQL